MNLEILKLLGDAEKYDQQAAAAQMAMQSQNGWGGGLGLLLGGIGGYMSGKRQRQATDARNQAEQKLMMLEKDRAEWEAEQQKRAAMAERQMKLDALIPEVGEQRALAIVDGRQALKDLQPEQTTAMQNAAAMGMQQGSPEYNAYIERVTGKAPGSVVNVNSGTEFGMIPEGFMMKRTPEGVQMVPVPGSPAEREQMQRQSKQKMKGLSGFQEAANIDNVIDNILNDADKTTTGFMGAIGAMIPGTAARDLQENLKTIEADAAFSSLQQMRENSVTGGALGTVSERELGLLSSAKAALSQSQSPEQFRENLIRYKEVRKQAMLNTALAYEQDFGQKAPWMIEEKPKEQPSTDLSSYSLEDLERMASEMGG